MSYKYYNQNNYASVPYPSPEKPSATVKSGGCGVVCASMIVENLTGKQVEPRSMAAFSIKHGARVSGGTDMNRLAKAICEDFGLTFTTTNNESLLLDHLRSGGMAIANVGGNRPGHTGVFSDGGHYIVCAGLDDGRVIVLDPGYYAEKFSKPGRVGKVKVEGNYCICDISVLTLDTANRSPSYWLFERKVEEVPEWMKKIMEEARAIGLISGEHNPNDTATKWFVLGVCLNLYKAIKGGK